MGSDAGPLLRIQHEHQAIIPSFMFKCCGTVLEWGVDLNPVEDDVTFNFDFQVWRPTPTYRTSGCYSLVDNFYATSISIQTNVTSEHVARVTPLPKDRLQFEVGDVLGFYVESEGPINARIKDDGVALVNDDDHTREIVWYASVPTDSPRTGSCPYPVGATRVLNSLTRAAPIISVSMSAFSCLNSMSVLHSESPMTTITITNEDPGVINTTSTTLLIALPVTAAFVVVIFLSLTVTIVLSRKIRRLNRELTAQGRQENVYNRASTYHPTRSATSHRHSYDYPPSSIMNITDNEAYGVL